LQLKVKVTVSLNVLIVFAIIVFVVFNPDLQLINKNLMEVKSGAECILENL
tara:strand:- start:928 stop:1080 length:153 start_codon:yes stop_codon:yes gene_type:complete